MLQGSEGKSFIILRDDDYEETALPSADLSNGKRPWKIEWKQLRMNNVSTSWRKCGCYQVCFNSEPFKCLQIAVCRLIADFVGIPKKQSFIEAHWNSQHDDFGNACWHWRNSKVLNRDIAPCHTSFPVREICLAQQNTATLPYQPYNPDLAPRDFYMLPISTHN